MRHLLRLTAFLVVFAIVADVPLLAQGRGGGGGGRTGGAPQGAAPQGGAQDAGGRGRAGGAQTNRDNDGRGGRGQQQAARTGTAVIRGRVVNATSGSPVRRAAIQASYIAEQGGRSESRTASTDDNGGFELRNLPAGRWNLRATKNGFIEQQYGQRSPYATTEPIVIAEGQQFAADFRLSRGGAISGRIVDEFGDPIAGANVSVLRLQTSAQGTRTQRTGTTVPSDDTGVYRVYGLPPGQYYVSVNDPAAARLVARLAETAGELSFAVNGVNVQDIVVDAQAAIAGLRDGGGTAQTASYAPTFYPGTANLSEAQRLTIGLGEEQSGINLTLLPVRAARITGRVVSSNGTPVQAQINLTSTMGQTFQAAVGARGGNGGDGGGGGRGGRGGGGRAGAAAAPTGEFTLSNIPPGTFTLTVRGANAGAAAPEVASMPLVVNGSDITGLNIVMGAGGVVTGSLVSDNGKPLPTGRPRITAVPAQGGGFTARANASENGAFTLEGLVGVYSLNFESLPTGWVVKSISANGLDVSDAMLDFHPGDRVTVRVELTDKVTNVTGTVKSERPVRGATVVVFPDEPAKWTATSRFIKTARVTDQGQFTLAGLPPHLRYLAVAIEYVEPGEAQSPEFLQRLKAAATNSFALTAGDQKALELPLVVR